MIPRDLVEWSEEEVRRVAHIIGTSSAAQKALDDYERRLAEGQKPIFLWSRKAKTLFVAA